jgi:hypothetical protein
MSSKSTLSSEKPNQDTPETSLAAQEGTKSTTTPKPTSTRKIFKKRSLAIENKELKLARPQREAALRTWKDKSIQKSNNAYITVVDPSDVPEQVQSYRMSQKEVIKVLTDEIKNME